MFIFLAALFIAAGLVHGAAKRAGKVERIDLVLVYLLAGYHGIVMLAVALFGMIHPARAAAMVGAPAGNVFQDFMAWAYLGMSVASILTIWLRGSYLVGPVVYWSVYFLGATRVHMSQLRESGHPTHGGMLLILATHAVLPCVMLALLAWRTSLARGTAPSPAEQRT